MKSLIHHVPADVANESLLTISEINSSSFDFDQHFEKESLAKLGKFYVCYKAKPWMAHDLMIIDSSDQFSRSISMLLSDDIILLGKIIEETVDVLSGEKEIAKVIIGANINGISGREDHESVLRLHVHVCALTNQEIDRMQESEESLPIFNDQIISRFKIEFAENHGFENYAFGIKKDLTGLEFNEILDEIRSTDEFVLNILEKLADDFSVLSYSFALLTENGRTTLYISPKSNDGRGVLETMGIILSRDSELKADNDFISERNNFLAKVKTKLINNLGAQGGKLNLEA